MLRLSCRELGGLSLWYCVLLARGSLGRCPPEKICFSKLYRLVSEAILDHFSRFVSPSLQLHMYAMPRGALGHKGGERERLLHTFFHSKKSRHP